MLSVSISAQYGLFDCGMSLSERDHTTGTMIKKKPHCLESSPSVSCYEALSDVIVATDESRQGLWRMGQQTPHLL